jgi:hypothetical protein
MCIFLYEDGLVRLAS